VEGIIINYDCKNFECEQGLIEQLESFAIKYNNVYVAPFKNMPVKIALTKLGRIETLSEYDENKIETFITGKIPQRDPEKIEEGVSDKVNKENGVREIIIDAKRFDFNPETITVKEGEKVKLSINNQDTTHGISIPDFGVTGDNGVEFTADKKGEFTFYCNNYCGEGHRGMQGKIIVE